MRRLRWTSLTCTFLFALAGCAGDEPSEVSAGGASGEAGTGDETGSDSLESGSGTADQGEETGMDSAGDGDGGDGDGDGGDGDGEPELPRFDARGVSITKVYANQGVRVPIADGEQWVDGSGRPTVLLENRQTLLRVLVDTKPDWTPREVGFELRFIYDDDTEEVLGGPVVINGPSSEDVYSSAINIPLSPTYFRKGMRFQVSLYDTDPALEAEPVTGPTLSPLVPGLVGIESDDHFIHVTLVPVFHDLGSNCLPAPVVTEADEQAMAAYLKSYNPVDRVYMSVREPVTWTSGMTGFNSILNALSQLRNQDGATPGEYYYGLVRPCDGGPTTGGGIVAGQAIDIPGSPTMNNGGSRVAVGRWNTDTIGEEGMEMEVVSTSFKETFVHEIGHTQGRRHSPCGDAGGPDGNYPYADADIGSFGYNAVKNQLFFPNGAKDYMSYCNPTHVSDYVWNRVLPYVQTISGWGAPNESPDADIGGGATLLVALTDADGRTDWHHIDGSLEGAAVFEMTTATASIDGVETTLRARVSKMSEGGGIRRAIELPAGLDVEALDALRVHGVTDGFATDLSMPLDVETDAMKQSVAAIRAWASAQTTLVSP